MDTIRRLYLHLRYDTFLTFVVGALTAGMIQIFSGDLWKLYGVVGLLTALLLVAIGFLIYRLLLWLFQKLLPMEKYPIGTPPTKRQGLIMVLGGGSRQTGPMAIQHHKPQLKHIWFVTTDLTETLASDLKKMAFPALTHPENVMNHLEPAECQNAVERALSHARVLGIEPNNLICDVTGGTTAMTVGAIQACLTHSIAAEMVTGRYDTEGKAVIPTSVILLDLHGASDELVAHMPPSSAG